MTYTKKVAFNTLVQIISRIILVGTSLVTVGILTRHLGVENFGRYTTALAFTAFFGIFADMGFFYILVRELSISRRGGDKIIANVNSIRTLVAIASYSIGFGIAWLVPGYDILTRLAIGVAAGATFWQTIQNTLTAVFQINFRMDKAALCDLFGRLSSLGIIIYLVNINAGLLTIMLAYLIGNFLNFALAYILARKYNKIYFAFDFLYWKELIVKTVPMGLAIVLHLIYFKIDTLMLGAMQGPEHVGIYGPSYKIMEVMLIVPAIFISSVLPIYAKYLANKDSRINEALQKAFDFLIISALPIVAGIFMLAEPIVRLIAGDAFLSTSLVDFAGQPANSATVLKILIFAALASFITPPFSQLLVADGKQKMLILPNLFFVIVNVALNAIFIPRGSYVAAAFVTVLTETLVFITMFYLTRKVYRFHISFSRLIKSFAASAAMVAILFFISAWGIFWQVVAGALVYISVLWLMRGVDRATVNLFLKKA